MPVFPRDAREALQQPRADTVALQCVGHGERHFGAVERLRIAVEAGEGHDPAAGLGDERGRGAAIGAGELPDPRGVESRQSQKAEIAALRRELLEKPEQRLESRSSAGRRQTVDPSRTTTSVAAAFVISSLGAA